MKVLACGGRDFENWNSVFWVLTFLDIEVGIDSVIHGNAYGADRLAERWAICSGTDWQRVPADWKKYGKRAGPIRNSKMLRFEPDLVIAFPGGRGTTDMILQARAKGVRVIEVPHDSNWEDLVNSINLLQPITKEDL